MPTKKFTGLQKEVLKLYRKTLQTIKKKPEENRAAFHQYVTQEFRRNQGIPRKDIVAIEFLLRKGQRSLEMLADPNVENINSGESKPYSPIFSPKEERLHRRG